MNSRPSPDRFARVNELWERLIAPTQPLEDEEALHRYRLLAGTMLLIGLSVSAILAACVVLGSADSLRGSILGAGIGVVLIFGLYGALRQTRHVEGIAALLIAVSFLASLPPFFPGSQSVGLYFAAIPILLTGMFFPRRYLFIWLLLPLVEAVVPAFLRLFGIQPALDSANAGMTTGAVSACLLLMVVLLSLWLNETRRSAEDRGWRSAADDAQQPLRQPDQWEAQLERRVVERTQALQAERNEWERRYREQAAAAEKLHARDPLKSRLLARLSHQLRTPLNAVLNYTEFVTLGMLGEVNERQQEALDKALASGRRLLSMINDVLDLTRSETGMMQLFVEDGVDLYDELAALQAEAQALIDGKPIHYVEDIDADLPVILGDRRRIHQVLLNLITYAVTSIQRGTVTLSVKRRRDEILFAVLDAGPSISPEDQEALFEPLQQMGLEIERGGKTGLELLVSLRLVEAHSGRLWIESEPDSGAGFYFTLPIRAPALIDQLYVG